MKTLLILRHAKSSWDNPDIADFDRPLNTRGLEAAPVMGGVLLKNNFQPQKILSSPAKRAKETTVLIKKSAQLEAGITYVEGIYEASPLRLLNIVSELEDKIDSVLLVGHNPGLEGFVKMLTGEYREMPTATLVKIDLNIEGWREINADCGKISLYIRPKDQINDLTAY